MKTIEVVAALLCRENEFLICRRPAHKARAGLYEFPGGKVEVGETPENALKREISEETGRDVRVYDTAYIGTYFPDEFRQLVIISYFCTSPTDSIILSNEHIDYKWVLVDKLLENICDNIRPIVAENIERIRYFTEAEKNLQRI